MLALKQSPSPIIEGSLLSERTVKSHLTSTYSKFDVDSRAATVVIATQNGWFD